MRSHVSSVPNKCRTNGDPVQGSRVIRLCILVNKDALFSRARGVARDVTRGKNRLVMEKKTSAIPLVATPISFEIFIADQRNSLALTTAEEQGSAANT